MMALLTAIFLAGAPPIPAVAGVVLAVTWLIWRAPPYDGRRATHEESWMKKIEAIINPYARSS